MMTIKTDQIIAYPKSCPICGRFISIMATAWDELDDGTFQAREIETQCETEPPLPDDTPLDEPAPWDEWFETHYSGDRNGRIWQGFNEAALIYVQENFRFDLSTN